MGVQYLTIALKYSQDIHSAKGRLQNQLLSPF